MHTWIMTLETMQRQPMYTHVARPNHVEANSEVVSARARLVVGCLNLPIINSSYPKSYRQLLSLLFSISDVNATGSLPL